MTIAVDLGRKARKKKERGDILFLMQIPLAMA